MESTDSFGLGAEDEGVEEWVGFFWGDFVIRLRCLLSFFFCSFLVLLFSLRVLTGDGIKFSKPGGIDGPEMDEEVDIDLGSGFLRSGLKVLDRWMIGFWSG